jgi:integrase/recombinase XerC
VGCRPPSIRSRASTLSRFLEDLDARFKPATVGVRFRSLQQLFKWMLEEGEITSSPMKSMRAPSVPEDPPAVLSDTELRALLKVCEGQDFTSRRDTAILRTFIDTGARLAEVANLKLDNVDLDDQTMRVLGKGVRVRVLPLGAKSVKALDRYAGSPGGIARIALADVSPVRGRSAPSVPMIADCRSMSD